MKNGITKAAGKEKLSIFFLFIFCSIFFLLLPPCGTFCVLFVQRVRDATQARQSGRGSEGVERWKTMGEGVADFSHEKCGSHLLLKIGRERERKRVRGDRPNEKMHIIIYKL